jgi:hypothetical protein
VPTALAAPTSSQVAHAPADDELTLAELLDLFDPEEPGTPVSSEHPSLRTAGAGLRTLRETWARRTAGWNIAPGGAWRAW